MIEYRQLQFPIRVGKFLKHIAAALDRRPLIEFCMPFAGRRKADYVKLARPFTDIDVSLHAFNDVTS